MYQFTKKSERDIIVILTKASYTLELHRYQNFPRYRYSDIHRYRYSDIHRYRYYRYHKLPILLPMLIPIPVLL